MKCDTKENDTQHNGRALLCVIMLKFIILSVIMLSVIMLSVIMLSVIMLSVVEPVWVTVNNKNPSLLCYLSIICRSHRVL